MGFVLPSVHFSYFTILLEFWTGVAAKVETSILINCVAFIELVLSIFKMERVLWSEKWSASRFLITHLSTKLL